MKKKDYKCLYNHELLILFTSQTPYQRYRENVKDEQAIGCVKELENTHVDALMCCPQSWMTPAYFSEEDRKWQDEAPGQTEPLPECDWKYFEKAYYRMRRYMLQNKDPVALSLKAAQEIDLDFFLSYRMNEKHHVNYRWCPTHSSFWRDHPEFHISPEGTGSPLNYLIPQVRERYLRIIKELVDRYDIDGFELDFMRSPLLFPKDKAEEGRPILTEFVRQIRTLLQSTGKERGKHISLCVRIPYTYELCIESGMDPVEWDRQGLIDMANVSPYFRTTPEVDISGFKKLLTNCRIYGEMHFNTQNGRTLLGYSNNMNRRTSKEMYETTALNFWDRGADGVSLFNFAYTRDHSFAEPRRKEYPGIEPPFDVLKKICDVDYLRSRPKHYILPPTFGSFPVTLKSPSSAAKEITLYIADKLSDAGTRSRFTQALLRLETDKPSGLFDISVTCNGNELERVTGSGELFPPFSNEALPAPENLLFCSVPLEALVHGENRIKLINRGAGEYSLGTVKIQRLELALYTG